MDLDQLEARVLADRHSPHRGHAEIKANRGRRGPVRTDERPTTCMITRRTCRVTANAMAGEIEL